MACFIFLAALYLIPREIMRIDSGASEIRQATLAQIEFEKVAHERLDDIFCLILDLVDAALEALEIVAIVVFWVETQEALAFVVV